MHLLTATDEMTCVTAPASLKPTKASEVAESRALSRDECGNYGLHT
jgi:hypothetical protein